MSYSDGPWILWDELDDDKPTNRFMITGKWGEEICHVGPSEFCDAEEASCNARLMKAAPELLEALEEVMNSNPSILATERSALRYVQAVEKARKVIKKARGNE